MSRGGYINLLQPQDRRSRAAGDSRDAVEARARLADAGIGRTILDGVVERAASIPPSAERPVVVDLGSGTGDVLAALAHRRPITGVGIDLSAAAARCAARRHPAFTWVVANADRRLPLLDRSVHLVVSVHARRNPAECARILVPSGRLLVAVPAPDDLIELRARVLGTGVERDRAATLVAEHAPWFDVESRDQVRERQRLERSALLDILRGTYRGRRASTAPRLEALSTLAVTLASDVFIFARRPAAARGMRDDRPGSEG